MLRGVQERVRQEHTSHLLHALLLLYYGDLLAPATSCMHGWGMPESQTQPVPQPTSPAERAVPSIGVPFSEPPSPVATGSSAGGSGTPSSLSSSGRATNWAVGRGAWVGCVGKGAKRPLGSQGPADLKPHVLDNYLHRLAGVFSLTLSRCLAGCSAG